MKFFRDTFISLVLYGFSMLLTVCINVIIARVLGSDGKGTYALLTLLSATITQVINLGLGQAAIFYLGQKVYSARMIANNLFSMTFVIGVPITILMALSLPWYGHIILNGVPSDLVLVIIILIPLVLGRNYVEYILMALQDFTRYNLLNLLDLGIRLLFLAILLTLGTGQSGVVSAIVVSTILSLAIGWYWLDQKVGRLHIKVQLDLMKRFTSYGLRSYFSGFMSYLNLRFDQFLVGIFLGIGQVGIYSVAVTVAELGLKLANIVTKVLFAQVSSLDQERAFIITGRTMRTTTTLGALTVGLLLISGSWLIQLLFGAQFQNATSALWLLLPGTLMLNISQILQSDLAGRGKPEIGTYANALSLIITLIGDIWLIPLWGIKGAALSSSVAYMVGALVVLSVYLRLSRQTLRQVLWVTWDDLATIWQIIGRYLVLAKTHM